ncbi:MAG: hypothetical protein ABSG95_09000 [Solirubrobacteraceae bacterium]
MTATTTEIVAVLMTDLVLAQAEETAERPGGGLVTREVAECRSALAVISG